MGLFPSFSSSGKNFFEPSIPVKLCHFYRFLVLSGLAHPTDGRAAADLARGLVMFPDREKHVFVPRFGPYAALPRAPNSGVSGGLQTPSCSSLPHVVRYWSHDLLKEESPGKVTGFPTQTPHHR